MTKREAIAIAVSIVALGPMSGPLLAFEEEQALRKLIAIAEGKRRGGRG